MASRGRAQARPRPLSLSLSLSLSAVPSVTHSRPQSIRVERKAKAIHSSTGGGGGGGGCGGGTLLLLDAGVVVAEAVISRSLARVDSADVDSPTLTSSSPIS